MLRKQNEKMSTTVNPVILRPVSSQVSRKAQVYDKLFPGLLKWQKMLSFDALV